MQASYRKSNRLRRPGGTTLEMLVETDPSYLSRTKTTHKQVPAIEPGDPEYPLAVRNINVFTLPFDDLAGTIGRLIYGPNRVSLETGLQSIETARAAMTGSNATVPTASLPAAAIGTRGKSNAHVLGNVLAERTEQRLTWLATDALPRRLSMRQIGNRSRTEWRLVLKNALSGWNSTLDAGRAITADQFVPAVVAEARRMWPVQFSTPASRDRLQMLLKRELRQIRSESKLGPAQSLAKQSLDGLTEGLRGEIEDTITGAGKNVTTTYLENRLDTSIEQVPRGVPVAPPPMTWYATVNAWRIQVRGSYARFMVRTPHGSPADPAASFAYIRDGENVSLDVSGNGTPKRMGRTDRVSFESKTWIPIAVPPRDIQGVGDAEMDEQSEGWPCPGKQVLVQPRWGRNASGSFPSSHECRYPTNAPRELRLGR